MKPRALELARDLIRFDTVNPPGNERRCAEYLGSLLERAGLAVTYHEFGEGRASLVARAGGDPKKPAICFTGHLDTVPFGMQPWEVDPLAAEVFDGKLWGRGSSDMKGGVAAFSVMAMEFADKLEGTPGIELVIVAGEETGCEGSIDLARKKNALGRCGAVVVAEPTSNQPWIGHKGALWLRNTTKGVTAHGSMPDKGVNAINKAARAIVKLEDFDFNVAAHETLGSPSLNIGTVEGGININSVPDRATFTIDIRTLPGQDHAQIREQIERYFDGKVEVDAIVDVRGIWTEPQTPWICEVAEIASRITGATPEIATATYFTDASSLTPAYGNPPTIILGPGDAAMAHQTNEYCLVRRIDDAVAIYSEITRRWCGL